MTQDLGWFRLSGVAVTLSILATACGGGGGGGGGGTPTEGGKVVVASWQEPDTLLGAGITDSLTHAVADVNPVMEGLLAGKATADVPSNPSLADYWAPALATEVPTAENGDVKVSGSTMSVTWKLRQNVKWQDGQPFTSKDVWATFEFWWLKYGANNPTPVVSTSGWDQTSGVDTPDDHTAVVHFKSVYGPYLTLGSGPYGILPDHLLEQTWSDPVAKGDMTKAKLNIDLSADGGFKGTDTWDHWLVGTGPFVFKEWVSGDHMTLVKNPNYWGSKPHLDQITIKFEPDTNTQLADLRTNTIDFGMDFRAALLSPLKDIANATTVTQPDSGVEKIDLNLHNQFLQDPVVRKAILMGIARQKIVDTLLLGKTTVPPDSWLCIGTGAWCSDPSIPHTKYDPTAAKKLLEGAGYSILKSGPDKGFYSKDGTHGIDLNLVTTAGNALREQQEVEIASDLAAIGIQVLKPFNNPKAGKLFGAYANGGVLYTHAFDMAQYTNTYGAPGEPDGFYAGYVCSQIPTQENGGQGQNDTYTCDKQLDDDFTKGRAAVALSDRRGAYVDAQKRLADILPEIPLYQQLTVQAYNNRLHGYKANEFFWLNNTQDWYVTS